MFFRKSVNRYAKLTHQQWGWLIGMLLGAGLGAYVLSTDGLSEINWEVEGKINNHNKFFKLVMKGCLVPLSSGLFANLFSNMGAGIDVITNKVTLLNWFYNRCCKPNAHIYEELKDASVWPNDMSTDEARRLLLLLRHPDGAIDDACSLNSDVSRQISSPTPPIS